MAVYFIDLDGTIFKHGTNDLLPGAFDLLSRIIGFGDEIVFTTYRGDENFKSHPIYNRGSAQTAIDSLDVPYRAALFDINSPRIVLNDGGAVGHNHETDMPWGEDELERALSDEYRGM